MTKLLKITFFLGIIFLISCQNKHQESLLLVSEQIIKTIPSASGVVSIDDDLWLVGDDAADLFQLDSKYNITNKYKISDISNLVDGRLVKSLKPDFESMDIFDGNVLILGSGSTEISRDTAVLFNLESKQVTAKANLRPLYNRFLELGKFDSIDQINIEGLASDSSYFYFLQRGNIGAGNFIYQIVKNDLLNYFSSGDIPKMELYKFELPKIDGYLSGFSGACISPNSKFLIFTASVESTSDVYHDGEVLGSFVGAIPITGNDAWKSQQSFVLTQKNKTVKTKIESVWVTKQDGNSFELVAVSDNDNGESGIYKLKLILN